MVVLRCLGGPRGVSRGAADMSSLGSAGRYEIPGVVPSSVPAVCQTVVSRGG